MATVDLIARLTAQGEAQFVGAIGSAETSVGKLGRVMGGALVTAAAAGGAAIVAFAVSGISAAKDLEAQMSGIAAVLQLTTEQVAPLKDLIQSLALDPTLKVNTTEAAAAIEMLARNGLGLEEIMTGAAHGTVLLANATNADFSVAANVATDVMAQFKIGAEDFGTAVDGITSVVNNSKFGINDYALAVSQGGGVAATAGVSFDDFNTTIAAISPLFASGSDAGTSFKTMLTAMANPSSTASSAIKELGLDFFDANGNMKDMGTIAAELNQALYGTSTVMVEVGGRTAEQNAELARLQGRYETTTRQISDYSAGILGAGLTEEARAKKLADLAAQQQNIQAAMSPLLGITGELTEATKQLTEEERTKALAQIFGSDAMRAAAGLAESGVVLYTDATKAVEDLGVSHEDLAWALEGGITQYEALMISMGQTSALESAATRMDNLAGDTEIFKGVIEGLSIQFGELFLPVLREVVQWGTEMATTYGGTLLEVIGFFFDRIESGMTPIGAFKDVLIEFAGLDIAMQFVAMEEGLRAFGESMMVYLQPIIDFVAENVKFGDVLAAIAIVIMTVAIPALVSMVLAALPLILTFAAIVAAVALVRTAWEENWGGIQEKTAVVFEFIKTTIANGLAVIKAWWAENGDAIIAKALEIWTLVSGHISTGIENAKIIISTALAFIKQWWAENGDAIIAKALEIWTTVSTHISTGIENAKEIISEALAVIKAWWAENGDEITAKALEIWTAVKDHINTGIENAKEIISTALATILAWWDENGEKVTATVEAIWDGIKNAYKTASAFVLGIIASALAAIGGDWETAGEAWNTVVKDAWEKLKAAFVKGLEIIGNAVGDAWPRIKQAFSDGIEVIKTTFSSVDWGALGTAIIEGVANAISAGVGIVQDAAKAMAQAALDAAKALLGIQSPSRMFYEIGENVAQGFINALGDNEGNVSAAVDNMLAITSSLSSIGSTISGVYEKREIAPLEDALKAIKENLPKDKEIERLATALGLTVSQFEAMSSADIAYLGGAEIMASNEDFAAAQHYIQLLEERKRLQDELYDKTQAMLELEKQQQDLALLKAQQDLLNLIRDNNLSASILDGLELGLDADLGAIMAAMSAAMQEMLAAAQTELGIASPSKEFYRIGQQVTAGLANALWAGEGMISNAMTDLVTVPSMANMSAASLPTYTNSTADATGGFASQTINITVKIEGGTTDQRTAAQRGVDEALQAAGINADIRRRM